MIAVDLTYLTGKNTTQNTLRSIFTKRNIFIMKKDWASSMNMGDFYTYLVFIGIVSVWSIYGFIMTLVVWTIYTHIHYYITKQKTS
jgi:hypothetical protein